MNKNVLYKELLGQINTADIFSKDLPDETGESTLKALWHTSTGNNCSSQSATKTLPDLTFEQVTLLKTLIKKRLNGIPLAHLTHRINFMGIELLYDPGVLAPRPETELLGYAASDIINIISAKSVSVSAIDVGCGCGNISCGIASRHSNLQLFSIDITKKCVDLTRKNIAYLHLENRITVYHGNLFSPLNDMHLDENIDIIVSNPPYIPSTKLQTDLAHLLNHEPKEAFDGGIYGFSVHQKLIKESLKMLKTGGYLLFEFGIGQEKQIQALFRRTKGYEQLSLKCDSNGKPRVAIAIKSPPAR